MTKKRGRPPPDRFPLFYVGCGRLVRIRDGKMLPCECQSCKARSKP